VYRVTAEAPSAVDGQRGVVETEGVTDQQPRVELRRIKFGLAKGTDQCAARLCDGHVRREQFLCQRGHQLPSAASNSA